MAAMSAGYFPVELPLFSAPNSIPMGMDNICQASAIMKAFMEQIPAFEQEASHQGIKPLFFHLLNPYLLVSKKPVTRFKDLRGMRIRTWGNDMPRLVRAAGAQPVKLFLPDLFAAMKNEVINACPFSVDLVVSYKIHTLAKHITEVVIWEGPSWGVWISKKAWDRLTAEQQEVFLQTAARARQREINATLAAEKEAREFLRQQGVVFHNFPDEELAKWKQASPDFFSDLVTRLEQIGKGNAARKMVDLWLRMRKRVRCP